MLFKLLLPILIVASLAGVFLFWQTKQIPKVQTQARSINASPKPTVSTYTNRQYGYSINYPADWEVQDFPNNNSGANFFPKNSGGNFQSVIAVIDVHPKTANESNQPLNEFIKTAGINEIQNYKKLNSSKEIKTDSGLLGWETTWVVQGITVMGATSPSSSFISTPITYFEMPDDKTSTLQITLQNKDYQDGYENMLKTLRFSK
ncbi:hypothetical protein HY024_01265 [Candidatus Curtissbacteria bacterium]|nr:hypothetical protein [Candidatus Curtissbacteria bacterium]